jgi:hypothetical protein
MYISVPSQYPKYQGEGTPKKLAIATQPKLPRNAADFKQAITSRLAGAH